MRVRLKTDLARYDARCVVGAEGETGAPCSMWARGSDLFVGVYFDSGASLDVLWSGLEIIDVGVLSEVEQ